MAEFNIFTAIVLVFSITFFYYITRPKPDEVPEKGQIHAVGLVDIYGTAFRWSQRSRWIFFLLPALASGIYLQEIVHLDVWLWERSTAFLGAVFESFDAQFPMIFPFAFSMILSAIIGRFFGRMRIYAELVYDSIRGALLMEKVMVFTKRLDHIAFNATTFTDACQQISELNQKLPYGQEIKDHTGAFARMGRDALKAFNAMPKNPRTLINYIEGQASLDDLRKHNILSDGPTTYTPGPELHQLKSVLDKYASRPGTHGRNPMHEGTATAPIQNFNARWTIHMKASINDFYEALSKYKAGNLGVGAHVNALSSKLTSVSLDELVGDKQGDMIDLYRRIHDAFDRHNLIAPNRLAAISKDITRIEKIETVIDLYNMKIQNAEQDPSLNEESRARKIQSLQHLMEREIAAMGAST